jgi:hypothetical protein
VGGEPFGSLIAQLRRTETNGRHPEQLLSRAVQASGLDDANDQAARSAATTMTTSAPVSGLADGGGVLGPARMSIHGADDAVAELMRGFVAEQAAQSWVVHSHARVADIEPRGHEQAPFTQALRTLVAVADLPLGWGRGSGRGA